MMVTCPDCGSSSAVQILPEADESASSLHASRWTRWTASCADCSGSWLIVDEPDRA
jgi:hypothetical protein